VFLGWEGVEAELAGVALNTFKLESFNVPYGYSPLLVAHPDTLK
jgi:NitT/TauT family transport system substrate-binding protein